MLNFQISFLLGRTEIRRCLEFLGLKRAFILAITSAIDRPVRAVGVFRKIRPGKAALSPYVALKARNSSVAPPRTVRTRDCITIFRHGFQTTKTEITKTDASTRRAFSQGGQVDQIGDQGRSVTGGLGGGHQGAGPLAGRRPVAPAPGRNRRDRPRTSLGSPLRRQDQADERRRVSTVRERVLIGVGSAEIVRGGGAGIEQDGDK